MAVADALAIMKSIIQILVGGLEEMGSGIGSALQSLVTNIMLITTGTGADQTQTLSVFGVFVIIFGAVSLCIGFTRLILGWVTSWGSSRYM